MIIRFAEERDIPDIERLLYQVCNVHSQSRPDLFKSNGKKYDRKQISKLISNNDKPIFVAFDEENQRVLGYAMCVMKTIKNNTALLDMKNLYIDDLCIDENFRGNGIGSQIYDHVLKYAKNQGCYNITLNVWEGNEQAKRFYDKCGLSVQKTTLEKII